MSGTDLGPTQETEQALIIKLERVLGSVPVGTRDLLRVLTHPDVISHTEEYIRAKKLEDARDGVLQTTMKEWNSCRDRTDAFPETCPICKEKWKHCLNFDDHISRMW